MVKASVVGSILVSVLSKIHNFKFDLSWQSPFESFFSSPNPPNLNKSPQKYGCSEELRPKLIWANEEFMQNMVLIF